jgi:hypothetical protein
VRARFEPDPGRQAALAPRLARFRALYLATRALNPRD